MNEAVAFAELGIERTTDTGVIRKAYAARLKALKRDMEPLKFQALRDAYEWALSIARYPHVARSGRPAPVDASAVRHAARPPLTQYGRAPAAARPIDPDRDRLEAAARSLEEALAQGGDEVAADRLEALCAELAHPVDGVSLDALAAFERFLGALIMRLGPGVLGPRKLMREAARQFRWIERAEDIGGDRDPFLQGVGGFLQAQELMHCAAGNGPYTDGQRRMAIAIVGPLKPLRNTRMLMREETATAFARKLHALTTGPGQPVRWLPAANVEWWRGAFAQPRLMPSSVSKRAAFFIAAILPLVLAIFGVHGITAAALTLNLMLLAALVFHGMAWVQDVKVGLWVRKVATRLARVTQRLDKPLGLPLVPFLALRPVLRPLWWGSLAIGLYEGSRPPPFHSPGVVVLYWASAVALCFVAGSLWVGCVQLWLGIQARTQQLPRSLAGLARLAFILVLVLGAIGVATTIGLWNSPGGFQNEPLFLYLAMWKIAVGVIVFGWLANRQSQLVPAQLRTFFAVVLVIAWIAPVSFIFNLMHGETLGRASQMQADLFGGFLALITIVVYGAQGIPLYRMMRNGASEVDEWLHRGRPALRDTGVSVVTSLHALLAAVATMVPIGIWKPGLAGARLAAVFAGVVLLSYGLVWQAARILTARRVQRDAA